MNGPWRTALIGLVVTLAVINAVSVFRQLSAVHLDPLSMLLPLRRQRLAKAIRRSRHKSSRLQTSTERKLRLTLPSRKPRSAADRFESRTGAQRRDALVADRKNHQLARVGLKTLRAEVTGEQQKAAADIGILSSEQFCRQLSQSFTPKK
jgi:hypothetical protein